MTESLDIVFRTLTGASTGLLAGLLLAAGRRSPAGPPGALFCLAVAAFFVTSSRGSAATLGPWVYPLTALCVTKVVWFWLFARALFNDGAGLRPWHLVVAGAIAIIGTWQQLIFLPHFRAGHAAVWEAVAGFGFDVVLLVFVLSGLYEANRDLSVDLVERRRNLRLGFILVTGVYLTGTLGVQSLNLLFDSSTPMQATWVNMSLVIVGCIVAAWFLLHLRTESWIDPARGVRKVPLNRVEAAVLARLRHSLVNDRIHLQQGLTVGELAGQLGTGEHVVRRVINHGMGHRNFNDFLHEWRIREACDELARPEQARESVLSVAMKVGYGSIGAFNRAFKTRVGMTPTDYRRRTLNGASGAH